MRVISIAIAGAGRMGKALAETIESQSDLSLAGIWARGENLSDLTANADVIIDFSLPSGTDLVIDVARRAGRPLVCGVSGLTGQQMADLSAAATEIPLVYDRNMSLGIAVLERSVRAAASALGPDFEVEIQEVHHVHKKDAPSGTALKLGEAIDRSRRSTEAGSVSYQSERTGGVPGDHTVIMQSPTERLSFGHSVTTRQVFVDGALRAARWVVDRPPGYYSMQDILFGDSPDR